MHRHLLRVTAVVAVAFLGNCLALTPVAAAAPTELPATVAVETTATTADLQISSAATVTYARAGEGVIRITTRVCGTAANWPAVAAANGIRPPVYLVRLGQRLTVSCTGGAAASNTPVVTTGWVAPVRACVVSGFGWRWGRMHNGVDLAAGYGVAIRAAHSGTVHTSYQAGGAGYYTTIEHGGGLATVYMHQSRFAVRSGWVATGQVIGYVGATGNATGPHLHFETHTAGLWAGRVNPVTFMAARGVHLGC